MCTWHQTNKCRHGETCRFAHSKEELRNVLVAQEDKDATSKVASKVEETERKAYEKLPEGWSASNGATKGTKSETRDARKAAAKKAIQAYKAQEDNVTPMQEVADSFNNEPMFIQPGATNEYAGSYLVDECLLSESVHHKLSETSFGFSVSFRRFSSSNDCFRAISILISSFA